MLRGCMKFFAEFHEKTQTKKKKCEEKVCDIIFSQCIQKVEKLPKCSFATFEENYLLVPRYEEKRGKPPSKTYPRTKKCM